MKHETAHTGQPMNFDPNQIAQTLTSSIRLSPPPIAICFTDTEKVPAGIGNWTKAATEMFATSPVDHDLCGIGESLAAMASRN